MGGIIFYQQRIKPSHFLVLRNTEDRIQKHIDKCPNCQKGAVKTIKQDIKIVSVKKIQLQKHLNNCPDCENKIVQMVKDCIESMAWGKSARIIFAMAVRKD